MFFVQGEVALRAFERVRADVEISHRLRAAARGVDGEATGKTEGIQHITSSGQRFDEPAVLALVEKEPGLLPAHNVRLEAQAGLQEHRTGVPPVSDEKLSVRQAEFC